MNLINTSIAQKATLWNLCDKSLDPIFWFLNSLLGVVILTGNLFTCFVFLSCRELRQSFMNNLLLSLAASDLLMGFFVVPWYSTFCTGCIYQLSGTCWLFEGFRDYAFLASVFNLFAITYDRKVAVFKPLLYHHYMNDKTLKCLLCLIWGMPLFLALIRATWRFNKPKDVVQIWNKNYTIFLLHAFVVFPIIVVTVINFAIISSIKKQQFALFNKVSSEEAGDKSEVGLFNGVSWEQAGNKSEVNPASLNGSARFGDEPLVISENVPENTACCHDRHEGAQTATASEKRSEVFQGHFEVNHTNFPTSTNLTKLSLNPGKSCEIPNIKTSLYPEKISENQNKQQFKRKTFLFKRIFPIQRKTNNNVQNRKENTVMTAKAIGSYREKDMQIQQEASRIISENSRGHKERIEKLKLRKGTVSCVTVIAVFILCWLPRAFYQECRLFDRPDLVNPLLVKLTLFFLFLQSSLNPFIYSFYRCEFRKAAWKLIRLGQK